MPETTVGARESDTRVYNLELPRGTSYYDADPGPRMDKPAHRFTTQVAMVFVHTGADRKNRTFVKGTFQPIDHGIDPQIRWGANYWVAQRDLTDTTSSRRVPKEPATSVTPLTRPEQPVQATMDLLLAESEYDETSHLTPDGKRKRR